MKLLIANHHLENRAGSELHTLDLCRGFRRAGHQVVVFTLKPGSVGNTLAEEGFPVFSLPDLRSLSKQEFDLIYLHHATCEILLGLIFSGKAPIIRGYLGIVPSFEKPVNGDFLAGKIYGSELVERTHAAWHSGIPSLIARNVYDDQQIPLVSVQREPQPTRPNFAIVTNHLDPDLAGLLAEAAKDSLCRYTHFGLPHNSVPITAELLLSFDAVVTIGRTVVLAAALGKPVYICGVHGAEGWLTRENFAAAQTNSFSGRTFTISNWNHVREQLLDTKRWPTLDDLTWLRERVERDHALSRRVEQLEVFFADIIEKAPSPVSPPAGYEAVIQLIEEKDEAIQGLQDERHRIADAFKNAIAEAKAQTLRAQRAETEAKAQTDRALHLEAQNRHLKLRVHTLVGQLTDLKKSGTWKVLSKINHLRAMLSGSRRRNE